jgi:peptide/nickel transport system ATP-binding protein
MHDDASSTDATAALLVATDLTIHYGDFTAVTGATLTVNSGERVALVGESGSGKTTLAMAVAGMLTDPSARVAALELSFANGPVTQPATALPTITDGISVVFQDAMTSLDPTWRIGGQLVAALRNRCGLTRKQAKVKAAEWLCRVGFPDPERVMRLRPYELSGGMRQRAMIAVALCGEPRLIVADEPTSALDATLSRMTMDLLKELTDESGAALLIVTHDLQLCLDYADKLCVMKDGEVVEYATAAAIRSSPQHPYTRGLMACVPTLDSADLEMLPTLDSVMTEAERALAAAAAAAEADDDLKLVAS